MKTHYIPAFVLRQFADDGGLLVLDKRKRSFKQSNPHNCGYLNNLYFTDLETGLLQRIDNDVSMLYRKWIGGRTHDDVIELRDWQKQKIAEFIALASIRTPRRLSHFKRYTEEADKDPQIATDIVYQAKDKIVEIVRQKSPELYKDLLNDAGKFITETLLVAAAANAVRDGTIKVALDPNKEFNRYINEERIKYFARFLVTKEWTWFYSKYGFVISDNPLAVYHDIRGDWQHDYGIAKKGVEITIPFSHHLCLRIRRGPARRNKVLYCNRERTRTFNFRQVWGSFERLFGPSRRIPGLVNELVRQTTF